MSGGYATGLVIERSRIFPQSANVSYCVYIIAWSMLR